MATHSHPVPLPPTATCGDLKVWRCALMGSNGATLAVTLSLDITRPVRFPELKAWAVVSHVDIAGVPVPIEPACIASTGHRVTAYIPAVRL